jgi:hypothetical protein
MLRNSRTYDDTDTLTNEVDESDDTAIHNTSVPVAHLVPIREEEEEDAITSRAPTMTIVGTIYIEEEHYVNNMDDHNKNTIQCKDIFETIQQNKVLCTLSMILMILFFTAGLVGTICGTTNSCSKDTNSRKNSNNPTDTDNMDKSNYSFDQRAIEMMDYINSITLSNRTIVYPLMNNSIISLPEELALQWMIELDPLQLLPNRTDHLLRIRQRYALRTLYFATTSSGSQWTNSIGWLNNDVDDECMWFGVICKGARKLNDSISTRVILDMNNNGLHGLIPTDIGLLLNLQEIYLYSNLIYGPLPETIGQWTSVEKIDMHRSAAISVSPVKLNGTLPHTVGNWKKLTMIDLGSHSFTGTLPQSMSKWNASIKSFIISDNSFSGTFPSFIASWANVTTLNMRTNGLNGSIPESIGNSRHLDTLILYHNSFTGTLPSSIQYLSNLKEFDVSENSLTGKIPNGLENWSNILFASFNDNKFVGSMPEGICNTNVSNVAVDCESTLKLNCSCCLHCNTIN